jgi:ribosomal protein L37AE/L43A
MDFAVSSGGLLVHARQDWPCAVCRPQGTSERGGLWLCLHCAHDMIVAAEVGVEGARALLDDLTDALVRLESAREEPRLVSN